MATKMMRQIKFFQSSTELMIPKFTFSRLVREIIQKHDPQLRCSSVAMEALQHATETFIVHMFGEGIMCSHHAKRVTLMDKDFTFLKQLKYANELL